nr:uncharacterized protein LOC132765615 [Anolis sagrei ordinatus]
MTTDQAERIVLKITKMEETNVSKKQIKIFCNNVNGLNSPSKRKKLFGKIKKGNYDLVALQETHMVLKHSPHLINKDLGCEFHSLATEKKRGVIIYAKEKLTPELAFKDIEGRIIAIAIKQGLKTILICNIYAPNGPKIKFISDLNDKIQETQFDHLILMGDFNGVINSKWDKTRGETKKQGTKSNTLPQKFIRLKEEWDLEDSWRTLYKESRDYTFYSGRHNSWSRIDMIWSSKSINTQIFKIKILPRDLSDHCALELTLNHRKDFFRWRLDDSLLKEEKDIKNNSDLLKEYFELNDTGNISIETLWDAGKAVMRGHLIKQKAIKNKLNKQKLEDLKKALEKTESKFKRNVKDKKVKKELDTLRKQRKALETEEMEKQLKFIRQKEFQQANKPGRWLSRKIRKKKQGSHIVKISTSKKDAITDHDILQEFSNYYEELYAEKQNKKEEIMTYLGHQKLGKISDQDRDHLNKEITEEEIRKAIKKQKPSKAPGPDGFTATYYKTFLKSWNGQGNLLHVFQGHSKTVTKILLHPSIASLFISGSLDGSVKLWSFDSMEVFYSISLFQEGILWIGIMEDQFLYCCSARSLHIYDLNSLTSFWTYVSSPISNLYLCGADGKSSRVVAMGVDNSLRIFSLYNGKRLSTVLPPPSPLLQSILSFTYNRASGTIYLLLTPRDIWVYTARTDPACRAAVWTIGELQQHLHRKHPLASCVQENEYFQHTRKRNVKTPARCECLCSLSSPLCYLTDDGMVYADNEEFLVLGMQDGRVLFLHTSIQNLVYYEMAAIKDPVIHLRHDSTHRQLIIIYQRSKHKLIHFRSLPALKLVFQIEVSDDTTVFTRLNSSLIIGLTSGIVDILNIQNEEKGITSSGKNKNENGENAYSCFDNYHDGPVVAVDSCENLSIFLSCGSDTVIKLWDLQKNLLAEITLDNTLSTACFLNSSGDILLAFKSDLYLLSLTTALGISKRNTETSTVLAAESFIFESPLLENIDVSKSIEMASYLEPYKGFAFTEDFTSELQFLRKKKEKVRL